MSKYRLYRPVILGLMILLFPSVSLVQTGEPRFVYSLDWSPDGTRLAAVGDGVWIYDQDLNIGHRLEADATGAIAWSPDGTKLAIGNQIWDARTFQLLTTIHSEMGFGSAPKSWSKDSKRVATLGDGTRDIVIFDATSGSLVQTIQGDEVYIDSGDWSPDDSQFVVTRPDHTIALMSVAEGKISALYSAEMVVGGATWNPDGQRVAVAGMRSVDTGTPGSVPSANGAILFFVQIRDMRTGRIVTTFEGMPEYPGMLRWRPDGEELVGGSASGTVFVWNIPSRQLTSTFLSAGALNDLAYSPLGGRLAMASNPAQLIYVDPVRRVSTARGQRVVKSLANGTLEIAIPSPTLQTLNLPGTRCFQHGNGTAKEAVPDAVSDLTAFIQRLPALSAAMAREDCVEEMTLVANAILAEQQAISP